MKLPFNARAPAFDANAIKQTIERALAQAGLSQGNATVQGVNDTIRRALGAGPQAQAPAHAGTFTSHAYRNRAGARDYKLYVPPGAPQALRPVLLMLHGCTQSAADFAAGTQMNRLADELGLLVIYPEQSPQANSSKCWNWFSPQDQQREAGEPSLLAGIVREVLQAHAGDPQRVFVAGLSAGAAMAVTLAQAYPEVFAGVGAHSGLPHGSAHDVPSALAAMKGGRGAAAAAMKTARPMAAEPSPHRPVPTIVFHGDRDHTVQHSNGVQIVDRALAAHAAQATGEGCSALQATTREGTAGGRRFSQTVHADAAGRSCVEFWHLHGAGHAWSGGHPSGSYTEAAGPDASAEMLRFFLALLPQEQRVQPLQPAAG